MITEFSQPDPIFIPWWELGSNLIRELSDSTDSKVPPIISQTLKGPLALPWGRGAPHRQGQDAQRSMLLATGLDLSEAVKATYASVASIQEAELGHVDFHYPNHCPDSGPQGDTGPAKLPPLPLGVSHGGFQAFTDGPTHPLQLPAPPLPSASQPPFPW